MLPFLLTRCYLADLGLMEVTSFSACRGNSSTSLSHCFEVSGGKTCNLVLIKKPGLSAGSYVTMCIQPINFFCTRVGREPACVTLFADLCLVTNFFEEVVETRVFKRKPLALLLLAQN